MWIQFNSEFYEKMRSDEKRIPWQNYGQGKFKPFLRLFKHGGFVYVTHLTSPKEKHMKLQNSKDLMLLKDENGKILSVVNLNFMFPVLEKNIIDRSYNEIRREIEFGRNSVQIEWQINHLKYLEKKLKNSNIQEKAVDIFLGVKNDLVGNVKYRVLDWDELERKVVEVNLGMIVGKEIDVSVQRSRCLFHIGIDDIQYTCKISEVDQLDNLYDLHKTTFEHESQKNEEIVNQVINENDIELQ